jgi:hypothetical protein
VCLWRTCLILVNGSPTEEIDIKRGLKQGDPLAPFLFLLVAEGLGGLIKRAVELNRFGGFRIGNHGVVVSHASPICRRYFVYQRTHY